MNRMLISATQSGEVRVALVKNQLLYDLDIERQGFEQKKGNIYKGRITRVEPSLEAAFVEYGSERHGFLPFKEVARSYFPATPTDPNQPQPRLSIKDVLKEGMEVIVQIDKEERGTKGAALTTFISLAGAYLVLMPNNPRVGGISRRIAGKERDDLRDNMRELTLPEGMGAIIRTAGVGKSTEGLQWDLDTLLKQWETICQASIEHKTMPCLIYQEGDAVLRAIRDYLRQEILEIIVDNPELYEKTKEYIQQVKPDFIDRIKLYEAKTPLFSFYQIEKQIESAHQRVIKLPSGGAIVIDPTEALVSVDVNSAKATGGSDIEETALNTNLEAADEIARQLRLRDMGGLVVIDFIDMSLLRNQREVSKHLRAALEYDRARVQVGNITRFGLLEMSRQRLRPYIGDIAQIRCPRCDGQGTIRSIESLASAIINLITEEAEKERTAQIEVQLPIELATFLLNEKRLLIAEIEKAHEARVLILPNQHLETPKYKIKRLRPSEITTKSGDASYKLIELPDTLMPEKQVVPEKTSMKPVVKTGFTHHIQPKKSFFARIFKFLLPNKSTKTTQMESGGQNKPRSTPSTSRHYQHGRPVQSRNPQRYRPDNQKNKRPFTSDESKPGVATTKPSNRRGNRGGNKVRLTPPDTNSYPEITAERTYVDTGYTKPNNQQSPEVTAPIQQQTPVAHKPVESSTPHSHDIGTTTNQSNHTDQTN